MSPEQITWRAVRAATRMYLADRPQVALDYLAEALKADPLCYEALVMAGELVDHWAPELGLDEREGASTAIVYFDRAIAARPDYSETYAEKAITLFYLDEYEASIATADQGLALFDEHPTADLPPDVWVNIGESLYRAKTKALSATGRREEARSVLGEGLSRFPRSEYLTQLVDEFLPKLEGDVEDE